MTRTMSVFFCFLLTQILVVSESRAWLNNPGKIKWHGFSGSPLRTVSLSSSHPLFLNLKSFLNAYNINDPPLKPCITAIYIPEPFEVTEKSSVILHKQYEVHEDIDEDEEEVEHYIYYNPYESSEENSSNEYEINYKEVTYKEDTNDAEDISDEEQDAVTDEGGINEEKNQNSSYSDDCDDSKGSSIVISVRL